MRERIPRFLWTLLSARTRSVEVCTAIILGSMVPTLWWGDWFGSWLHSAGSLRGTEVPIGTAGLVLAVLHIRAAHRGSLKLRQTFALISSAIFATLAFGVYREYGFNIPGTATFTAAALIQGWVYLALESDRVDAGQVGP